MIDTGNVIGGIFIDLKKAFDRVSHSILLHKLASFGITGLEQDWFNSYLSDTRKQATKIGNVESTFVIVQYGVPQGSILGPLLFTMYINIKIVNSINVRLKSDLAKIALWMHKNKLTLNAKESKAMLVCSRRNVGKANDLRLI